MDPEQFNFSKVAPSQRILQLKLSTGRYDILTNKWPTFRNHMLLVAKDLVSQKMNFGHLIAVVELLRACSFSGFFNSWCGGASVNHFHAQLIDEIPPVALLPLVPGPYVQGYRSHTPKGYPGKCYVFDARDQLPPVDLAIRVMQARNQPHNILFTPARENLSPFIYIFPKPHVTPSRSRELYVSKVGASEVIGSFTTYTKDAFDSLSPEHADELVKINTAKLPEALLRRR